MAGVPKLTLIASYNFINIQQFIFSLEHIIEQWMIVGIKYTTLTDYATPKNYNLLN